VGVHANTLTGCTMAGNLVSSSYLAMMIGGGERNRLERNRISRALGGLAVTQEKATVIDDVTVEDTQLGGLYIYQTVNCHVSRSKILGCGFDTTLAGTTSGIYVDNGESVTIDNCEIMDTGRSSNGIVAAGTTYGILISFTPHTQIHGNRIRRPADVTGLSHRAIELVVGSQADIQDNVISGSGNATLVELFGYFLYPVTILGVAGSSTLIPHIWLGYQDVIFSGNRCTLQQAGSPQQNPATVVLGSLRVSLEGNQVRTDFDRIPSFAFFTDTKLSATGNITSGLWTGSPIALPTPVDQFNHIHV